MIILVFAAGWMLGANTMGWFAVWAKERWDRKQASGPADRVPPRATPYGTEPISPQTQAEFERAERNGWRP
jgi:hypothetical protein